MSHADRNDITLTARGRLFGLMATALMLTMLLFAASAQAGIEQLAAFASAGEGRQLRDVTAMAVNESGAGGVTPGSLYATAGNRVLRYGPSGEFEEAWGWNTVASGPDQSEGYERCRPAEGDVCTVNNGGGGGQEAPGNFSIPGGIAVDQTTGYVYVLNSIDQIENRREHNLIEVFSADGSQAITSFGDAGTEAVEADPEKIHSVEREGLAVDPAGIVYVFDHKSPPNETFRVMTFTPQSPGDYSHYAYAGRPSDVSGFGGKLAVDQAGNLYVAKETGIYEFAPGQVTAPACEIAIAKGGVGSLAVDSKKGTPFYFSAKNRKIHRLSACNEAGKFTEVEEFTLTPKPEEIVPLVPLAFDAALSYGSNRPRGILYAANGEREEGRPGTGYIFAPAEVHPPAIEAESVIGTGSTSTTLRAQINPSGYATHYFFQYLSEAEYEANEPAERFAGAREAPLGGADLAAGQVGQTASGGIVGLSPDTVYRFRVIASSECEEEGEACVTVGEAASFATYPVLAPGLPDHRAYELVSPVQKNGGEVFVLDPWKGRCFLECKPTTQAPPTPEQSSAEGGAITYEAYPFSPTEGSPVYNQYISRRTATGWQTTNISPPLLGTKGQGYLAVDPSFARYLIFQQKPALSPEAPAEYGNFYSQETAAPTPLQAILTATPENRSASSFRAVYAGASSDLSRIFFAANDILPTVGSSSEPTPEDPGEGKKNLYEWSEGQLHLVNVLPGNAESAPGAIAPGGASGISADGSRVFWEDGSGQLYVREGGETTREIQDPGHFLAASPDGSKVLLTNGHLYDLGTETATDLSEGQGGFLGLAGQSEDLSHLYFVDTKVLTEAENEREEKAQEGKNNLYSWSEGQTSFVTTLTSGITTSHATFSDRTDWNQLPAERSAEASPDGRFLAFASVAKLTGHENFGPTCARDSTGVFYTSPCNEAFLYDSVTGKLSCASCNPSGEAPLGPASLPGRDHATLLAIPDSERYLRQVRYLSDEGRLYFDTQDSLVPTDTNEGHEDVYQYEPQGAGKEGSCEAQADCTRLISAGSEPDESNFLAMDESGANVFFTTRDRLVLRDKDDLYDLYDAREGGGLASETEVGRSECQGEACQAQAVVPNDPTPGSSTFEGAGNVKEEAKAKKHAKKHKHKHAKKKRTHKRAAKHNRGGAK
jgi:hypothetical protein